MMEPAQGEREHESTRAREHESTRARQHDCTTARQHDSTTARQQGQGAVRATGLLGKDTATDKDEDTVSGTPLTLLDSRLYRRRYL
jgi:hypothetical protein